MCETNEEAASIGSYVVVQRQNYYKLYKVTENGNLMLGKDQLEMNEIVGEPYWTTFKMEAKKAGKRLFVLKKTKRIESLAQDLRNTLPSGSDNRGIQDDGTSQKLSTEEIVGLRESGKSGKEIVGQLIENSKTFQNKTEYSQEKYLKKKEKKYFEYITIRKPTVRLLQEIYFRLDHQKINGLRMDTLAQICSYCDVKASGLYILYDSGSQGLSAATLLDRIGSKTSGQLLHLHPGNIPQKTLVHAMNFPAEQLSRMLTVNIYSLLRMFYQSDEQFLDELKEKQERNSEVKTSAERVEAKPSSESIEELCRAEENLEKVEAPKTEPEENAEQRSDVIGETSPAIGGAIGKLREENCQSLKRKQVDPVVFGPPKKPRWLIETQDAVEILRERKAEGLAILAKEHPLNILKGLLPFLGASRPFVIYHALREPLQETYVALKQRSDVINLRLFSNFLRSYQVLPDRTHPDILMSDTGGYLLCGYFVN